MAKRRYAIAFYVAILIGAATTYGVFRVLQATKESGRIATRPVVVALSDLPDAALIHKKVLVVKQWPLEAVPTGAFSSVDSVAGRVTRVPVFAGEAMVPGRLAPVGTGPGLEARITPGMRAMAVRINDVAGLGGLIQPNSRVDILVTLREGRSQSEEVAKLFMENMRVLSVGSKVNRGNEGDVINATTATLEVTPEQAERLAVATRRGTIQLVLRGYGEQDSIKTKGASSSDVFAQLREAKPVTVAEARETSRQSLARSRARKPVSAPDQPPPTVVMAPPVPKTDSSTVRVYRGNQLTQQKFQKDSGAAGASTTP